MLEEAKADAKTDAKRLSREVGFAAHRVNGRVRNKAARSRPSCWKAGGDVSRHQCTAASLSNQLSAAA